MNKSFTTKAVFYVIAAIIFFTITLGCSSPESIIIGKWGRHVDGKEWILVEFFKDNTFIIYKDGVEGNVAAEGKYSILDDGRVKMEIREVFGNTSSRIFYQVKGTTLILLPATPLEKMK